MILLIVYLQFENEETIPHAVQIIFHGASFQPVLWQFHSSLSQL